MKPSLARRAAAVVAAVGAFVALTLPHSAVAAPPDPAPAALGHTTTDVEEHLRTELGPAFAGAWLTDDDQQWVVALTDPALTDRVVAAGARPQLVAYSEAELSAVMTELDRTEPPPVSVTGWYVDVVSNTVVVEALPEGQAAAVEFVEASGVDDAAVRVVEVAEAPQLRQQYPLREADPFYSGGLGRCTIGFLVLTPTNEYGYVTAGHCGGVGTPVQGYNGQSQGAFWASVFPGRDYGVVTVNRNWVPTPRPFAEQITVVDPPVGSPVCKAGSTSGWTCGTITAKNVTVNYPQGTVYGLTRTTMCSEPGDSGAPVFANGQPYGIVTGASGNCSWGGVTFVQPLLPVVAALNLRLLWY